MSNKGKKVKVHYVGTLDNGEVFDSSRERDKPIEFTCMKGQMIPGFDRAVENMQVGDIIDVHIEPQDAYGMPDPSLIIRFPLSQAPNPEQLKIGDQLMLRDNFGAPHPAVLIEITEEDIALDLNHEMAGKALNFEITLLSAE